MILSVNYSDEDANLPWFKSIQICEDVGGFCYFQEVPIPDSHAYEDGVSFSADIAKYLTGYCNDGLAGGDDLDYEKLHLTLARHSPIYAKILIENVYINYFNNIKSYTDDNISNLKDLLHHLDKRIHELISSGSKKTDMKTYSSQKYDPKENTINIQFNYKNLPLNILISFLTVVT